MFRLPSRTVNSVRRRARPALLGVLTAGLTFAGAASAYFTTTGSGSAAASTTTLSAPGSVAAAGSGPTITVTWSASTVNASTAATSYTVERYSSGATDLGAASCSPVAASTGSPNAFGSFSCADSPAGGTYEYKVTALYASWSATSGFSNTATAQGASSISAAAPATGTTGSQIGASSISAILSGAGSGATGTITVKVFGPQSSPPTSCTSGGTTVGTASVSGNGTYHPSAGYTPTAAGTYWWYASYSGDANDVASASTCGSGMTSTAVGSGSTATTASGPASGSTGSAIATSAITSTLSGATSGATGTITFKVFGPQSTAPSSCTSGGSIVGTASVSGSGTYHPSAPYTPASAGTYWWYASYGGDANNGASTSTCGSGMSSTVVSTSTITTAAAPATDTSGTAIGTSSISSTLSGAGTGATGTITFKVFGPQATAPSSCTSGGTTVGTATVSGNGTYHPSAGYTPSTAGTYWWYVSYGGDSGNAASASTCATGMTSTAVWTTSSVASVTDATKNSTSDATSNFTVQPNTTYLLLVYRDSASGDSITGISSSGLTPSLNLSSFTSITSQNYNTTSFQWAYYLTTSSSASGAGSLSISFTKSLPTGGVTIIDLVALGGNSTTAPVIASNEATTTGSSATGTAGLPNALASGDASLVFLSSPKDLNSSAPAATPAMTSQFYSHQESGTAGTYTAVPGNQNESFTFPGNPWGTLALELARQ